MDEKAAPPFCIAAANRGVTAGRGKFEKSGTAILVPSGQELTLMNSALVTGAYGFVGRHVSRALARRGVNVVAIGHGAWGREEWRDWGIAEWHQTDISLAALKACSGKPDAIFHCAGGGSVGFSITHPLQDFERSVTTTLAILEYARTECPGVTVILPSSAAVYGIASQMPIKTDTKLDPVSPYGSHKKLAEDLCASYGRHFGVHCAIIRFFSVFGAGLRKQLLWDACSKLVQGRAHFGGTGTETRDWLHVEDVAELMLCAHHYASSRCPVVNGGTGVATPIKTIISLLADELSVSTNLVFSGVSRPGDPLHHRADITLAEAWGWRVTRFLEEEVRAYARWFVEEAK